MRGLAGKVAIVTGGLGDLGFATARRLVEEHCKVVLLDLKEDTERRTESIGATFFQANITDSTTLQKTFETIADKVGPAAVLINTAAHFCFKGIDATLEDYQRICAVNIAGTSLVTQQAVQHMKKIMGGSIINFSSISGFIAQPDFATYNATKFAIRGLTKCWAQDLAPYGIRVNTLCPGYIFTSAFVKSCEALGRDVEIESKRVAALHLLNRQGKPEEVASVAAFLASDESSFMTGADVLVDGGYTAI
jgi:NAD(P)-dependent dehydrogenase (short-subunit alcohol dehydrogenase family)